MSRCQTQTALKIKLPTLLVLPLLLLGFSSCTKKEKVGVPAYLKIDAIDFQVADATQGTSKQKISEAYVYVNDNLQGIYDLPCEVPLLNYGSNQIKIRAGIRRNGTEETHIDYPFFNTFQQTVNLEELKTTKISPVLNYFSDARIWDESFEDAGYKFQAAVDSDTGIVLTNNPAEVFEGSGSGKIVLSGSDIYAKIETAQKFKLPRAAPVFMELHYKCNNTFSVGLMSHIVNTGETFYTNYLYLLPSDEWNKVYINLSDLVNKNTTAESFDVFFEMGRTSGSGDATLLIDNVKILYPQQ